MLEFKISKISDIGKQRKENQDYYKVNEYGNLIVLGDGIGSSGDGKLASRLAVCTAAEFLSPIANDLQIYGKVMESDIYRALFEAVNKAEQELKKSDKYLQTTIDIILIDPSNGKGYGNHLGDGRVYLFNKNDGIYGLSEPLTTDDLKKKHRSILRNSLIGECLFLIKYIEEWGTGTNRIINSCINEGLPEPIFEEVSKSLVVTLRKHRISEEDIEKLNERQKKQ